MEREFTGPDGRLWRVRERREVRHDDGGTDVALELETQGERRVVTCRRDEWDTDVPDFAGLLDRSVPGGASRSLGAPEELEPPPERNPDDLSW